ncbi:MAG: Gfo/Idh/MocA family oxidoreductase [Thermoproteota archaeon]
MSERRIRVGIIGCGIIAASHVSGYLKSGMAEVVALSDNRVERAEALAEKYRLPHVKIYGNYEDLLKDGNVDAVSVCVPHHLHSEITVKAAEYGKHVLCEKPIAISLKQADEMIEACRKNRVKLAVVFQNRFSPDVQRVKKDFEKGDFGIPIYGEAVVKWYREDKTYYHADEVAKSWRGKWSTEGGGALINQTIHLVDMLQWIMGSVEYLYGIYETRMHDIEAEDIAVSILKFKSGAVGFILGSVDLQPQEDWVAIYGSKKSVVIGSDKTVVKEWGEGSGTIVRKEGVEERKETVTPFIGHDETIRDFIESIREDKPPAIPGEEARKSLEIVLAIYRAHRTGSKVTLPLVE